MKNVLNKSGLHSRTVSDVEDRKRRDKRANKVWKVQLENGINKNERRVRERYVKDKKEIQLV